MRDRDDECKASTPDQLSGRDLLKMRAIQMRRFADHLDQLAVSIPELLHEDAELALKALAGGTVQIPGPYSRPV